MNMMAQQDVEDELRAMNKWMEDPSEFPTMRSLSPALLFFRRVLVYRGPEPRLEFLSFEMPSAPLMTGEMSAIIWKLHEWNLQWEAGPYRAFNADDLPKPLAFLRDLQTLDQPTSDIVLVPRHRDNIYDAWAPLYHLLPRRLLQDFRLPIIERGIWPRGLAPWNERIRPDQQGALEQAFARHVWANGMGRAKSPLLAFSETDPLKLLSHDLSFWRAHMEVLLRDYGRTHGRVARRDGDSDPESIPLDRPDVSFEMPRFGCEVWAGEEEATEVTKDLIEVADERGRVRAIMDAIRSHRVEEDFSKRWSGEREDFERKLYRKRNKVKVSFVELHDSIPYFDGDAELDGDMLYRNLLSVVDPKERRVVVCLHSGITGVKDIAAKLGYANHSPVSKALKKIRVKAAKWLD